MNIEYLGNQELLRVEKTAFLAPRKVAPGAIMPSYDRATELVRQGRCVVSGFTSPIERDVWDFLVRGTQPIILVTARSKYTKIPSQYIPLLDSGRLLIIFLGLGTLLTRADAFRRNEYVAGLADDIIFGSMHPNSSLYAIYNKYRDRKPVAVLG